MNNIFLKLSVVTLFLTQFWLIAGAYFSLEHRYLLYGAVFGLASFVKPKQMLYILLIFMVVFGSRPPVTQTHYLILISAFWILGAYGRVLIKKDFTYKLFLAKLRAYDITLFFTYLFIFVSFVSLIGLPVLGAIKHSFEEGFLYPFSEILRVGETTLYYSVQSVFYLFQAYLIGLYIYGTTKKSNSIKSFKHIFTALFLGWILFIIFGYLDFFGFYDLSFLRQIDGVSLHRLVSFFPNSSWSAQYLAVTLPLLPLVLIFYKPNRWTILLMILLIVTGEVALILSMQRGAWMTYPPTLLMIWITIYYVIEKSKNSSITIKEFAKKNWLKVFVTIPITILISVSIVYEIKDYRKTHKIKSATDTFVDVTSRAKKVTDSSNRKIHWPPAIKLF